MRIIRAIILGIAVTMSTNCAFCAEQEVILTSFQGPATYDGRTLKQVFMAEYGVVEKIQREVSIECNRGAEPYIRLPLELIKSDLTFGEIGRSLLQGVNDVDPNEQGLFLVRNKLSKTDIRIQFRPKIFNERFLPELYKGGPSFIIMISQSPGKQNEIYKISVVEPTVKKRIADIAFLCPTFD